MTKFQAEKIKEWRQRMTFRRVSEEVYKHFPSLDVIPDNQLDGRWCCEEAAVILQEKHWDWVK